MGRKKLLEILPTIKVVWGFVKLNYYTEIQVRLPLRATLKRIRERLTEPGPSSRNTSRFSTRVEGCVLFIQG